MYNAMPIPMSLKVVAFLFILSGAFSAIEVVVSLTYGHLNINFGVLALFVGPGLLRLSRSWRTCALIFLMGEMIGIPIIAVIFMSAPGPLDFTLFGQKVGHVSKALGILLCALTLPLVAWQYRVLTRSDVRSLFGPPGA